MLIAINPFKKTAECSAERIDALIGADSPDTDPPHVYRVSRSAYSVMCATGGAQSILISGESGAGKTEAAKLCMLCLARLSSPADADAEAEAARSSSTSAALDAGLVLEAFGNAKTCYNDNSSRFGKWVEIHFGEARGGAGGRRPIASCTIHSYLLEISRVVNQAASERNYHIFYQLLAARGDDGADGGAASSW